MQEHQNNREIVPVDAKPVEASPIEKRPLPPIVAKTVNLCVNCVQAPGRMATRLARERYHRHYHPRHRFGRHHLAADFAFVAGIVVLLGVNAWLLLGKPQIFPSKVRLTWEVPSSLRVGDAAAIALRFTYDGDTPLATATIAFQFPRELRVDRVEPGTYDAATRTLTLPGALAPGASGTVTIAGVIAGAADQGPLDLRATFHGTGESRAERTSARASVPVAGVAIALDLIPPATIPANGIARFRVIYRSDATIPMGGIIIRPVLTTPLGLVGDADGAWGAARPLAPKDVGAFAFDVSTGAPGTFPVRLDVVQRRGASSRVLGSFDRPVVVTTIPVAFGVASQGDGPPIMRLGESVEIGVSYQGVAGAALPSGLASRVGVRVDGPLLKHSRLTAPGATVAGGLLTWPYIPVPEREIGGVAFTLTAPATVDVTTYGPETQFAYTVTPLLILTMDADGTPTAMVTGTPFTLDIVGELRVYASARYFTPEGDQLGRGPLPPRVGSTTKYWVAWDIRGLLHDADAVTVRAVLPSGVEWVGRAVSTLSDAPQFDAATRTMTWNVGRLTRAIGNQIPAASASFEVALIPTAAQVGTFAPLLGETNVSAVGITGTAMQATAPAITTELPLDQRVRGKGRVEL